MTQAPTSREIVARIRQEPKVPSRSGHFVVAILVLAAFGPYVTGGIRTEQIALYGLLATVGFVRLASRPVARMPLCAWALFAVWTMYVFIAAAVDLGSRPPVRWEAGSFAAGLDNLAAPLTVMLLVWSAVTAGSADVALRLAAKLVAICMALNGVLAVTMTRIDLLATLRPFWASEEGISTAERAASGGRFSGVFNQPAEAGIAYGIAALCAWYVWRDRPGRLYLVLLPIVAGGLLSISKVFILGGLPVILWLLLRGRRSRGTVVFVSGAAVLGVVQSGLLADWTGSNSLARLLSPGEDQNLVTLFTAGRFGEGSTLGDAFEVVWHTSPWVGFGIRGLAVPSDNLWLAAYVTAGVLGVVAVTVTVLILLRIARREVCEPRRVFATGLVIVVLAGSMGLSALTANRVTTLVWLLFALIVLDQSSDREPRASRE